MIKGADILKLLDKQRLLVERLTDETFSGLALIVPPEGDSIEIVLLGSQADSAAFFKLVAEKCVASRESSQYGGVVLPAGIRSR